MTEERLKERRCATPSCYGDFEGEGYPSPAGFRHHNRECAIRHKKDIGIKLTREEEGILRQSGKE